MATATETKPRAPKATLVMKLIDGKLVPRLAKSDADLFRRCHAKAIELASVSQITKAKAAAEGIAALLAEVDPA